MDGKGYNRLHNIVHKLKNGNGYLKEFENSKLKFEGEYINCKINGKGKEYNTYGILLFEAEYLNGKNNGKGKEYDLKGKLRFEGEYLNNDKV